VYAGDDLEQEDHNLLKVITSTFSWIYPWKTSCRIAGNMAEIRSRCLQLKNIDRYRNSKLELADEYFESILNKKK
jgi:hypothetical protein